MDKRPAFQRLCTFSLLSNLSNSGRTTNLKVANDYVTWAVYFRRGKIVFASHSVDPFERLQRHLNRLGHNKKMPGLDEARARINIWEKAQQQDYLLLNQWVNGKLLRSSEMAKLIEGLVLEVVSSLLLVNEGYYKLDDSKILPASFLIERHSILSECQVRLNAWQALGPQINSPYQRPCLSEQAKTYIELPSELSKTLKGFSSFYQLGVLCHQDELELAQTLHPYIETGDIRLYNPIPPFNKLPNTFVKESRKTLFSRDTSSENNGLFKSALTSTRATSTSENFTEQIVSPITSPLERVTTNVEFAGQTLTTPLTVVPNHLTVEADQRGQGKQGEQGKQGGERVNAFPATRLQAPDFRYGVCSPCSPAPPAPPALFPNRAMSNHSFRGYKKSQQYTIACVDDSPTVLATISQYLDDESLSVELISNPVSALMKIIRLKPKLILLDVTMASIDGYELCRLVRNHSHFRETPIIMVTGNTGIIDRVKARLVGASGYLTKPFNQADLLKIVFKHLKPELEEFKIQNSKFKKLI